MTPPEEKPDFQQRMDWHFAAHFDENERQNALSLEEVARQRALEAAAPRPDEELTYEEPSYQYMFLDEHEVTGLKTGGGQKCPRAGRSTRPSAMTLSVSRARGLASSGRRRRC